MSNNGGFKQTPDPVTFLGGFSSLCSWLDYCSWQVLLCSGGQSHKMIGSKSPFRKNPSRLCCQESTPRIIIPPATQARDFATILVYCNGSNCVTWCSVMLHAVFQIWFSHIRACEFTRADLSSV